MAKLYGDSREKSMEIHKAIEFNSRVSRFLSSKEGQDFQMEYEPRSVHIGKKVVVRWYRKPSYMQGYQVKNQILDVVNPLNNRQRNSVIRYLRGRPKERAKRIGEADKPGPGRTGRRKRRNASNMRLQTAVSTIPVRVNSYLLQAQAAGTTFIFPDEGVTGGAVNSCFLDCFSIGGRLANLATDFIQYRIKSGSFRFRSANSASGVTNTTGAATSSPTYSQVQFCYGVSRDPTLAPTNFNEAVDYGGILTMSSKMSSCPIPPTGWKFINQPNAPSLSDIRQCSFGRLYAWPSVSFTAATSVLGYIEFNAVVQFKGSNNSDLTGFADPVELFKSHQRLLKDSQGQRLAAKLQGGKSSDAKQDEQKSLGSSILKLW
jgi:hypothetical protein